MHTTPPPSDTPPDIQKVLLSKVPRSATIPRLCVLIRATPEGNVALNLPVLASQTRLIITHTYLYFCSLTKALFRPGTNICPEWSDHGEI